MSSEEQQRWEGKPPREDPPRDEPREAENISEAAEMKGAEDPGTVPEAPEEDLAAPVEEPLEEAPLVELVEITQDELSALADELELARRERDEYLDNMRRMKAELENSRKRLERERARFVQLASERLVRELLPILDNLERALEVEGDIREGVAATRDQLVAALGREGLAPVFSDGEHFDPAIHEAVMSQPSDEHEEDTVIKTLERGYLLNGKPIRPAKVIVAKQV
ncbi:MAG: nucleotide exchange factor GrpE [Actinomycetota bacterium]|nr:nucleotide exchange factor GrpE [Actinomycetota bacterium]